MKLWKRLTTDEHCGRCGQQILRDAPICLLIVPNVKRPLLRCESCAGPPDDALAQRDREIAELRQADLAAPPPARPAPVRRPQRVSADWLVDWENRE